DEATTGERASARGRERWLRRQATEGATLVGTLLDLAEAGAQVAVWTAPERRVDGVPVGVGPDVVVLRDRHDHVAVRIAAITVVRPGPGQRAVAATGDRSAAMRLDLVELLARLVDDRPDVAVVLDTGESLTGALVAVGADVLTLQVGAGGDLAYASVARSASVRFRSG
ncbi:MAG: hypothetical protein QOD30_116, partial [Actinomycetota bacterium]|nr:hypothetical protein [Actinomycetota bacterium]